MTHFFNVGYYFWQVLTLKLEWKLAGVGTFTYLRLIDFISLKDALAALSISLFMLITVDLVTGVRSAWQRNEFTRSKLLSKSLDKAVTYFSVYAVALVFQRHGDVWSLKEIAAAFMVAAIINEVVSILENLARLGNTWVLPFAQKLRMKLDKDEQQS